MEHRPAAGEAAGQMPAFLFQQGGAALLPSVLIAPDDHGVAVLPQVEDAAVFLHGFQQVLLHRQVVVGVGLIAQKGLNGLYHTFSQRSTGLPGGADLVGPAI